jgi:hypothetical protein
LDANELRATARRIMDLGGGLADVDDAVEPDLSEFVDLSIILAAWIADEASTD